MSLRSNPHHRQFGSWLTIVAMCLAALASVQLVIGAAPGIWLLAACAAVSALLAQASKTRDSTSIGVPFSRYRARSAQR